MYEKIVTKGSCSKCKLLVTRASASSHIHKCFPIEHEADAFLVKVQWPHKKPIYWMYMAVQFKATLEDFDNFLRETWLECCSHLSCFTINGVRYFSDYDKETASLFENSRSMSVEVGKVLAKDRKFIHEYDFGSTTELLLEVVGLIESEAPRKISILMRNEEPAFTCSDCDEKAVAICPDTEDYLCEVCGDVDEMLPLVNSPRTGVCGYVG